MTAKHQLNSKLAWPVCTKNTKLKQNGTGAMTQFFFLSYDMNIVILGGVERTNFW